MHIEKNKIKDGDAACSRREEKKEQCAMRICGGCRRTNEKTEKKEENRTGELKKRERRREKKTKTKGHSEKKGRASFIEINSINPDAKHTPFLSLNPPIPLFRT